MFFGLSDGVCWVIIIVCALIIEAVTLNLSAIWFALGGVISLISVSLGASIPIQWVTFLIASAIFLSLVRPFAKHLVKPRSVATNADRILGEQAMVTQRIDNSLAVGEVKIMGQYWTARSADGAPIEQDTPVRVCEIVGVKVIVEPLKTDGKE